MIYTVHYFQYCFDGLPSSLIEAAVPASQYGVFNGKP